MAVSLLVWPCPWPYPGRWSMDPCQAGGNCLAPGSKALCLARFCSSCLSISVWALAATVCKCIKEEKFNNTYSAATICLAYGVHYLNLSLKQCYNIWGIIPLLLERKWSTAKILSPEQGNRFAKFQSLWPYHCITLSQNKDKDQLQDVIIIKIIAGFCCINRPLVMRLMEAIILLFSVVLWLNLALWAGLCYMLGGTDKMQTIKITARVWKPVYD